jgi:hypothetical protein
MNAEERKKFLSQSLAEAARKTAEEDELKAQIARVTAIVNASLGKKAETSQSLACPHCGEPLPEDWRTDPITSDSDTEDDEDNDDSGDDEDDGDYDNRQARLNNRKPVRPFSGLTRAQVMASLGKIRC